MKILVTGSLGYIGTVLVPMLLERDHDVIGLDTDLYSRCTFTGKLPEVDIINADVRDLQKDDLVGLRCANPIYENAFSTSSRRRGDNRMNTPVSTGSWKPQARVGVTVTTPHVATRVSL